MSCIQHFKGLSKRAELVWSPLSRSCFGRQTPKTEFLRFYIFASPTQLSEHTQHICLQRIALSQVSSSSPYFPRLFPNDEAINAFTVK